MGSKILVLVIMIVVLILCVMFFHKLVLVRLGLLRRCTETIIGELKSVRYFWWRRDIDDIGYGIYRSDRVLELEYTYNDKKYTGYMGYPAIIFRKHVGDYMEFKLDPNNPYEIIAKSVGEYIRMAVVVVMLIATCGAFVFVGKLPSQNGNFVSSSGDKAGMVDISDELSEDVDTGADFVFSNSQNVTAPGLSFYLPMEYRMVKNQESKLWYKDDRTGDMFSIVVSDNSENVDTALGELRNYVKTKYPNSIGPDSYVFHSRKYEIYTFEYAPKAYCLVSISAYEGKKAMITLKKGINSQVDIRDILATLRY